MTSATRALLIRFDERDALEFPSGFDYKHLEQRTRHVYDDIARLTSGLKFQDRGYNQDASFSIAILLCEFSLRSENTIAHPTVVFSNFGNLVTINQAHLLPDQLAQLIPGIFQNHGFHYLPAADLKTAYDGVNSDLVQNWTWHTRYFDWRH